MRIIINVSHVSLRIIAWSLLLPEHICSIPIQMYYKCDPYKKISVRLTIYIKQCSYLVRFIKYAHIITSISVIGP